MKMQLNTAIEKDKGGFATISCTQWLDLKAKLQLFLDDRAGGWVFRGQTTDWQLKTSLERACDYANIAGANVSAVERQMVRSFRRSYSGGDREIVLKDDLYCMALMQHYGAPTRLLDFTYSPYIGLHNAIEKLPDQKKPEKYEKRDSNVIWCISGAWCNKVVREIAGNNLIDSRNTDPLRDNTSFGCLYDNSRTFVFLENPFLLNTRLTVQQGLFLCPGNSSVSFEDNLKSLGGWERPDSVLKIRCDFEKDVRCSAMSEIYRMGISRASLYPGLDGFATSYMTRAQFFFEESEKGVGGK